ncbi:ComEC/Rec2 family competence protein [candidate division WOR-3 bacterium]|uniref:ComEC/Rec2 family competence protein n=1 Tax=candidate division WOR-3 bacterium TaxID=2052148 RepID=A0A938BQT5_UNCW3|nr:ComEC/Rec2 family competence protein [candidate division WOR-3 bacterium]
MSFTAAFAGRAEPGMRHAAARALVAAAAGILLGRLVPAPLWLVALVAVVAVGLARVSRGWSLYLAVGAAAMACGQVRAPGPVDPRVYAAERFEGTVESEPAPGVARRAVVSLSPPLRGKVTVWLRDSAAVLRSGDVVMVGSRIEPLDRPRNPGVPDFNSVLSARGFVGSASAHAVTVLARGRGSGVRNRLVAPVRSYIFGVINQVLPGNEGALLVGLLLGGSQGLPKDVQEAFRDAGLVHILAVSGMNVSIVVGFLWILLSVLGVRGWWRFWAGVAGVVFYLLLVGWSAAPARAGLMACAVLLSAPTQRRLSPVASLCAAGILLLLIDPAMLFDVGAQLSFAATLGIVLIAGPTQQLAGRAVRLRWFSRWVLAPVVVSVAATLFTAPLLLHHFSRVQPLAFATSAAVIPLVGLAMPLGIVVLLANLVSHWLAAVFAQSLWLVLWALLQLTLFMGRLDWAIWEPGRLSWFWVAWAYLLGLLALRANRERVRTGFAVLLVSGLCVMAWEGVLRKPGNSATFLDPKQGDAILLEDSLGHRILFDAGVNGTGVLRDYLRSRGIHRLDAVVVTHPDNDHYGGLLDLPRSFRVRRLLVPTTESRDPDYQGLLTRLHARGTEVVVVGKGTHLTGSGFQVDFLWPDDATRARFLAGAARTNDISLVASVTLGKFKMLLPGDLDNPDLLAGEDLRADLLKSPHHGSLKGNPPALYERVRPDYVLVMGRYPTPARLEPRFKGTGVDYVNTRVDGAVTLRLGEGRPKIQRFFARLPLPAE